jgi:type I restriction enzyme S subunit
MSLKSEFRIGVSQREVAFGQDCKAIIPAEGIDGTFLALAIKAKTPKILGMVDEAGHGTGRLPADLISQLKIGVPGVAEQQRIAETLDTLDDQIAISDHLLSKLRARRAGSLSYLLNEVQGVEAPLINLLSARPRNGYSPKEVDYWTGALALGLGCLTLAGFEASQLKNVPFRDPRNAAAMLRDGDLLMSRANTRELVGMVGRYREVGVPCIYPDLMMLLTPNAKCRPEFLEIVLRSVLVRRQIQAIAQGTSESMVKISGGNVMRLTVTIPELLEQERIVRIIDQEAEQIEVERRRRAKLKLLKQGLMEDLLTGRVRVDGGGLDEVRSG